ncbi:hypothetical protein D2C85_02285 [Helicobacter pylori]|nr:hypothetical protein D2C85_02285 [Helicobacter pylori]
MKISVIQAIIFITQCKRPKVKDKPASHKETPKLFRLRGTLANTLLFYRKDHFKPLKRDFNV